MSEEGYGSASGLYWNSGWKGVLPLPPAAKLPPPKGTTGYDGFWPSFPDIAEWQDQYPDGNLALRLPNTVVGIDVDMYDGKRGDLTLAEAISRWGELPPTVRSTSRIDGHSGIRLYRIPAGVELETMVVFPEKGLGDIEVIQFFHRYCIAWPSIHPKTGRRYRWLDQDGNITTDLPRPASLPMLPESWLNGLRRAPSAELTAKADVSEALRNLPGGNPSPRVDEVLRKAKTALLGDSGTRHDTTLANVLRLLRLAEQGEPGIQYALTELETEFVKVMTRTDSRTRESAELEFRRMVTNQRGHDMIASNPTIDIWELANKVKPEAQPKQQQPQQVLTPPQQLTADDFLFSEEGKEWQQVPAVASMRIEDDYDAFLFADEPEESGVHGSRTSWGPVDIEAVLAGDLSPEEPSFLRRGDGKAVFYRGRVNALVGEPESGKAVSLRTPVLTPTGWRPIGELSVGDEVIGLEGETRTVTGVFDHELKEVYELETGQGDVIECCGEHLWLTRDRLNRRRGFEVRTTAEMAEKFRTNDGSPRWSLPVGKAARFAPLSAPLPVRPYMLGLLLGDGGLTREAMFTNPEPAIWEALKAELPDGMSVSRKDGITGSLVFTNGPGNPLISALRDLGLFGHTSPEKFIPEVYQRADISDRLALLQGLMDTDGSCEGRGNAVFNTSSPKLAEQVKELVQGLGGTVAVSTGIAPKYQGGIGLPAHRVAIHLPLGIEPFRNSAHKLERYRAHTTRREPVNRVVDIRRTGRLEPMRCISVSGPDRLYRVGGHTITHNTWVALVACKQVMEEGGNVYYIDFEDTPQSIVARFLTLGVPADLLRERLLVASPDEGLSADAQEDIAETIDRYRPEMTVVDGVNAAMTMMGLSLNDNNDATRFHQMVLKPLTRGNAAVITIDHVTKAEESRKSFAIGAQAKKAMTDGAMIGVRAVDQFGRGRCGKLWMTVLKDKPGGVRALAERRGQYREDYLASVIIDATNENLMRTEIKFEPREDTEKNGGKTSAEDKLIVKMMEVSQFLESIKADEKPVSTNMVVQNVPGRAVEVRAAVNQLVETHHVVREQGPRGALQLRLMGPYRGPEPPDPDDFLMRGS